MKKIKSILFTFFIAAALMSCENDGGTSNIDVEEAGVPNIQTAEGSNAFIDLLELQDGNPVSVTFTADIGEGDVSSMDIIAFYRRNTGELERTVLASNVTTFPSSFTVTDESLINSFEMLESTEDFALGDQLIVSAVVTLENGNVYSLLNDDATANYGPDIANSIQFSVVQVYNVACPSDLEGTYTAVSSGESTDPGPTPDENPIEGYESTVTLTANGGGSYNIDDPYGGLYHLWYDIYGLTPGYPVDGTISDVCGTISGAFGEPFGTTTEVTGTVNDDGTITYSWINGYGDAGTVVLTPQ